MIDLDNAYEEKWPFHAEDCALLTAMRCFYDKFNNSSIIEFGTNPCLLYKTPSGPAQYRVWR